MGRLLPALLLVISGCAGIPDSVRDLPDPGVIVELTETPFFPQDRYQCGPAALATVLSADGIDITPEDLVEKVYLPARQGSLQVEMLATTRMSGRIPLPVDASLAAIVRELENDRPVIVLQNLGVSMFPRWHYAVVVGVDGANETVVLRSGIDERRETPFNVFLRTWARSDFWGFSVLRPGAPLAGIDRERYVVAVADLEDIGRFEDAALAWQSGLEQWPDDTVIQFGLGNTLLKLGRAAESEHVYRQLLAAKPELNVVRNNLAIALKDQSRFGEALAVIDAAIRDETDPALIEEMLDTKREVQAALAAR